MPKFRVWMKSLKCMCDVTNISFDSKFVDICQQGDTERYTEMSVEFDEITLMQSTGLKDKNGKEIFEGDILKSNKYTTSVFYERGAYRVKLRRTPNTTVTMDVIFFIQKYKTKIVGNIYDNPELLEDK